MDKVKAFFVTLWALIIGCCSANGCYAAEHAVSVDVGPNVLQLIEKLASSLGVGVDKVLPWYVNQSVIDGATTLGFVAFFVLLSAIMMAVAHKDANYDCPNWQALAMILAWIFLVVCAVAIALNGATAVSKILNPQYYAVHNLIKDVSNLR